MTIEQGMLNNEVFESGNISLKFLVRHPSCPVHLKTATTHRLRRHSSADSFSRFADYYEPSFLRQETRRQIRRTAWYVADLMRRCR